MSNQIEKSIITKQLSLKVVNFLISVLYVD